MSHCFVMTQKAPVGIRMCLLMQCLEECLNVLQVGPVLCQGYISEKTHCTNWTQNTYLKQCISWGLGD